MSSPADSDRKARLADHLESMIDDVERRMQALADQRRTLRGLVAEVRAQAGVSGGVF